ncbi:MAG: GTPase domain-containing protein [bacterium]
MRDCLIVGKTHAGKTLFVLNFAQYLGLDNVDLTFKYPNGLIEKKTYSIAKARRELVGPIPHTTRALQTVSIDLPVGKGVKRCFLTDTSGLIDHIHSDVEVRRAIAQTLGAIREADLILHLVDAAAVGGLRCPNRTRRGRLSGGAVRANAWRLCDSRKQDGSARGRIWPGETKA